MLQAWRKIFVDAVIVSMMATTGFSQNDNSEPGPVVIRREPLRLTAPEAYRLELRLEPVQQLIVAAVCDGTVLSVDVAVEATVKAQELLVRLDPRERHLMLERARAHLKVTELELAEAKKVGQGGATELADARHHAAEAEVKLLQFQVEQLAMRAPFSGTVLKVHVQPGQFVKSGEPLLTLADVSRLKVDVPVDRELIRPGDTIALKVENQSLELKAEKILPAESKFEKLRDIATSLATTTLVLDNDKRTWHVGQSAFVPLAPRHPVTQVMTSAVGVDAKGHRKVQVVRQGIIRDIEVDLLGQVGAERIFVSGSFVAEDQLVLSSSRELADGTQVRPNPNAAVVATTTPKSAETVPTKQDAPKKKSAAGF